MSYCYALIDNSGKCYEVRRMIMRVLRPCYVPIDNVSIDYLSKYYWPIPNFVDCKENFCGQWYLDAGHTIKGVTQDVN